MFAPPVAEEEQLGMQLSPAAYPHEAGSVLSRATQFAKRRVSAFLQSHDAKDAPSIYGANGPLSLLGGDGARYYLMKEVSEAREMINKLDRACENALSFREKSSKLLEEAHRTLGRLEQALATKSFETQELIPVAADIKACVRRGLTLVDVYGGYSTLVKVATLMMRKSIYHKFDTVIKELRSLLTVTSPCGEVGQGAGGSSGTPHSSNKALGRSSVGGPGKAGPCGAEVLVPQGIMLREGKHERVYCMAFVPNLDMIALWWSAGNQLAYYNDNTGSTVEFRIDKDTHIVTAINVDGEGNVWTGHIKGLLRVRQRLMWDFATEDKAFSSAVKVIAFDDDHNAWVGDEAGKVKVVKFGVPTPMSQGPPSNSGTPGSNDSVGQRHVGAGRAKLEVLATLQQSLLSRITEGARTLFMPAMFARLGKACEEKEKEKDKDKDKHANTKHNEGPIRAIYVREGRAWISGGVRDSAPWLTMYDTQTYEPLDTYDCITFGPATVVRPITWPQQLVLATDRNCLAKSSKPLVTSFWRIVTGHENGQILLWHPASPHLSPLLMIGEPSTPVRGISVFDDFGLVCVAHNSGEMHIFRQPKSDAMLPPGSESTDTESFGMVKPRKYVFRAHKSQIQSLVGTTGACITSSMMGTVRLWRAAEIAEAAQRHGIQLPTPSMEPSTSDRYLGHALSSKATGASSGGVPMSGDMYLHPATSTASSGLPSSHTANAIQLVAHMQRQEANMQAQAQMLAGQGGGQPRPHSAQELARVRSVESPVQGQNPARFVHHGHQASSPGMVAGQGMHGYPATDAYHAAGPPADHQLTTGASVPVTASSGGTDMVPSTHGSELVPHATSGLSGVPSGMPSSSNTNMAGASMTPAFMSTCQTIDSSELVLRKLIGRGAYGQVWLAEWTGCQVAVKELLGFSGSPDDAKMWQEMQNEVHMLGTYNHPNIMRFMAVCVDPPMIVMQYYPHGSLFDLLSRARNKNTRAGKELSWNKRLDMLRDVAAGMHYLHTRRPPVIHGDLRSPNLLLDLTIDRERPRFHVKIADFGLARMLGHSSSVIVVSKTTNPRWTAPEVIRDSQIGPAGDVYSFAIIMWEMLTWQQPFEDMMSVQVIFSTVTDNYRPHLPPDNELPGPVGATLPQYKALMERCWSPDSRARPTFKQIVDIFQAMRDLEAKAAKAAALSSKGSPPAALPTAAAVSMPTADVPAALNTDGQGSFHTGLGSAGGSAGPATASTSASSVKSGETAALLAVQQARGGSAVAKDSASSMQHQEMQLAAAGGIGASNLSKASGVAGPVQLYGQQPSHVDYAARDGERGSAGVSGLATPTGEEGSTDSPSAQSSFARRSTGQLAGAPSGGATAVVPNPYGMMPISEERSQSLESRSSAAPHLSSHLQLTPPGSSSSSGAPAGGNTLAPAAQHPITTLRTGMEPIHEAPGEGAGSISAAQQAAVPSGLSAFSPFSAATEQGQGSASQAPSAFAFAAVQAEGASNGGAAEGGSAGNQRRRAPASALRGGVPGAAPQVLWQDNSCAALAQAALAVARTSGLIRNGSLENGEDLDDPLESYRSGAMEEFGYGRLSFNQTRLDLPPELLEQLGLGHLLRGATPPPTLPQLGSVKEATASEMGRRSPAPTPLESTQLSDQPSQGSLIQSPPAMFTIAAKSEASAGAGAGASAGGPTADEVDYVGVNQELLAALAASSDPNLDLGSSAHWAQQPVVGTAAASPDVSASTSSLSLSQLAARSKQQGAASGATGVRKPGGTAGAGPAGRSNSPFAAVQQGDGRRGAAAAHGHDRHSPLGGYRSTLPAHGHSAVAHGKELEGRGSGPLVPPTSGSVTAGQKPRHRATRSQDHFNLEEAAVAGTSSHAIAARPYAPMTAHSPFAAASHGAAGRHGADGHVQGHASPARSSAAARPAWNSPAGATDRHSANAYRTPGSASARGAHAQTRLRPYSGGLAASHGSSGPESPQLSPSPVVHGTPVSRAAATHHGRTHSAITAGHAAAAVAGADARQQALARAGSAAAHLRLHVGQEEEEEHPQQPDFEGVADRNQGWQPERDGEEAVRLSPGGAAGNGGGRRGGAERGRDAAGPAGPAAGGRPSETGMMPKTPEHRAPSPKKAGSEGVMLTEHTSTGSVASLNALIASGSRGLPADQAQVSPSTRTATSSRHASPFGSRRTSSSGVAAGSRSGVHGGTGTPVQTANTRYSGTPGSVSSPARQLAFGSPAGVDSKAAQGSPSSVERSGSGGGGRVGFGSSTPRLGQAGSGHVAGSHNPSNLSQAARAHRASDAPHSPTTSSLSGSRRGSPHGSRHGTPPSRGSSRALAHEETRFVSKYSGSLPSNDGSVRSMADAPQSPIARMRSREADGAAHAPSHIPRPQRSNSNREHHSVPTSVSRLPKPSSTAAPPTASVQAAQRQVAAALATAVGSPSRTPQQQGAGAASSQQPKPYAPLSHFSPFSAAASTPEANNAASPVSSLSSVSTQHTPAPQGPAFSPSAVKYYSPLSAYSPFAGAGSGMTDASDTPGSTAASRPSPVQAQGASGSSAGAGGSSAAGQPYAPLSQFSPFAQGGGAAAASAQAQSKMTAAKPYAPMSQHSPFAQAAAPAQAQQAGVTPAAARPYAPMSQHSLFAQAEPSATAPVEQAQATPAAAAGAKPYAPMSQHSPFAQAGTSAAAPAQQPHAKPYAPLSQHSPFAQSNDAAPTQAAQTTPSTAAWPVSQAAPPAPAGTGAAVTAGPSAAGGAAAMPAAPATQPKLYAPMSKFSPFAAAALSPEEVLAAAGLPPPSAAAVTGPTVIGAGAGASGAQASAAKLYAPLSAKSPFANN